jgi:predicted transcriptional regulator
MTLKDALLVAEGRRAVTSGRLGEAIAASDWNQSEWGEILGVSDATISRWLAQQRAPRKEQARRIALVLRQLEDSVAEAVP